MTHDHAEEAFIPRTPGSHDRVLAEAVKWYLNNASLPAVNAFERTVFARVAQATGRALTVAQLTTVQALAAMTRDLSITSGIALMDTLHAVASAAGIIQERDQAITLAEDMAGRIGQAINEHGHGDGKLLVNADTDNCEACRILMPALYAYRLFLRGRFDVELEVVEPVQARYEQGWDLPPIPVTVSRSDMLRMFAALGFHPGRLRTITFGVHEVTGTYADPIGPNGEGVLVDRPDGDQVIATTAFDLSYKD